MLTTIQKLKHIFLPARARRDAKYIAIDDVNLCQEFGYDEEIQIKAAVQIVRYNTMCSFERLATLWQQVRYLDKYNLTGALVECGSWKGGAVGMMALAHLSSSSSPSRKIHIFDSFQGLPEPRAAFDGQHSIGYAGFKSSGAMVSIGKCVGSLKENKNLLENKTGYPAHLLKYHVGWFQNTLPADAAEVGPIALLRLDGDWYESTRICLEHLYPLVIPRGVVVIDDYGHWEGCRKAVDEFLAKLDEPILLGHIDYTGRYWVRSGIK